MDLKFTKKCLSVGIMSIIFATSCQTRNENNGSKVSHDIEQIQDGTDKDFVKLTKEEVIEINKPNTILDNSYPMIAFLDAKAKEIHNTLTEKYPEITAPVPDVYGLVANEVNAFASYTLHCMPIKMQFKKEAQENPESTSDTEKVLSLTDGDLEVGTEGDQDVNCHRNLDMTEQAVLAKLKYLNFDIKTCFEKNNDVYVYKESCSPVLDKFTGRVSKVMFGASANSVVFNTGILTAMNERQLLSVLTHELAHYYRKHVHTGAYTDTYNFFYEMDRYHNESHKPKRSNDQELNQLGETMRNVSNDKLIGYYPMKSYNWLSPIAFKSFVGFGVYFIPNLEKQCADGSVANTCVVSACEQLISKVADISYSLMFPFAQEWPKEDYYLYGEIEKLAEGCLSKIPVTEINARQIRSMLNSLEIGTISESEWVTQKNVFEIAKRTGILAEYKIAEHNKKTYAIMQKAYKKKLGFYTYEQNADEVGLEIAYLFGLNANDAYNGYLALFESKKTDIAKTKFPGMSSQVPQELDYELCKKSLEKGFPDFVPLANYKNLHHSTCFRVYNVFREYQAHKQHYDALDRSTPDYVGDDKRWAEFQSGLPKIKVESN